MPEELATLEEEEKKSFLESGLKIPEKLEFLPATYKDNLLTASMAYMAKPGLKVFAGVEYQTDNAKLGEGVSLAIEGLREEISDEDDTPGVLTIGEAGAVLFAAAGAFFFR